MPRKEMLALSLRRLIGATLANLTLSMATFAQEEKADKPYDVLKEQVNHFSDSLREGILRGVKESASPMEHSFRSYVMSPANGNYEEGPDTFCRWLIGQKGIQDKQAFHLLIFVTILSGTSESMDLPPLQIDLPSDKSRRQPIRVLLRIPGAPDKPTAKIIAAVEVRAATHRHRYVVSKEFYNQMNEWMPGCTQTEIVSP